MPGGQPPKYNSPEEIQEAIEAYFNSPETLYTKIAKDGSSTEERRYSVTKLAYYLGFESRQSIYDYGNRGEYSYIIKRALLFIEGEYELNLQGNNPSGSIFALKNMGWTDKQEIDQSNSGEMNITITRKVIKGGGSKN